MRPEASEFGSRGDRKRTLAGARRGVSRKSPLRRAALEALEPRTLLSNLPAPQVAGLPIDISNTGGNQSAPSIAVDPNNPEYLAAAWTRIDSNLGATPVVVEAAYSTDGGTTWSGRIQMGVLANPATNNPTTGFPQVTDAHVAFDRSDNFYVLDSQHTADFATGEVVLNKFGLAGGKFSTVFRDNVVYEWVQDQAYTPTLAVDSNLASFTDPTTGQTQNDPNAGDVYVAWATKNVAPKNGANNFNPDRVAMAVSSDGGKTFSAPQPVDDAGNYGNQRYATPQVVVAQGATTGGVQPGQVTIVWDDFNSGSNFGPPRDLIDSNAIQGRDATVTGVGSSGPIAPGTNPGNNLPIIPGVTNFTAPVSINDPNFSLSDLSVTLNLTHPSVGELQVVLTPPTGSGLLPFTLVSAGSLTGANLGTAANGSATSVGTTFDDNAVRAINDGNNAAPYTGVFRPTGGSLNNSYQGATAQQLSGTWTLTITDTGVPSAPGRLTNWSLHFTEGMQTVGQQQVTSTYVRGSLTGASASDTGVTPLGGGPGLSLSQDNTLGSFSPYQGRLYLAYVDRSNVQNNQADNTDIFLITSDNGGQFWSNPGNFPSGNYAGFGELVNSDNGATDGFSESNPGYRGRPQLEPQVAVDQATGSLVMSWYDARNDASRVRVATYVTASNDGGQSFSPQVYLNQSQTAVDAITGKTVSLGPIPDSAAADPNVDHTFGFGVSQGLAVYGGTIHAAWSSDLNGGNEADAGQTDGKVPLNIRVASATIPAGPRVISSDEGPVAQATYTVADPKTLATLPPVTINQPDSVTGNPTASGLVVTFDRPVDPTSFGPDQVQVFYHDTTTANAGGQQVPVTQVNPIASSITPYGATQFLVQFSSFSGVGTYSYTIGPGIRDSIRTKDQRILASGPPRAFASTDTPLSQAGNSSTLTSSLNVSGFVAGQVVENATVNLSLSAFYDYYVNIALVAPDGTSVTLYDGQRDFNFNNSNSFYNNNAAAFSNTTFSDAAATSLRQGNAPYTGQFRPDVSLSRLIGHPIDGTWQLKVTDISGNTDTLTNWTLNLTPGSAPSGVRLGNTMDQNANGVPGEQAAGGVGPGDLYAAPSPTTTGSGFVYGTGRFFSGPYDPATLPLIVPGPHVISTSIPGGPAGPPAGTANLAINGPVSALNVTFDRDIADASFTPAQVLQVMGPAGSLLTPQTYTATDVGQSVSGLQGGTILSSLSVPNDGSAPLGPNLSLSVNLNISATVDGDLTVQLVSPQAPNAPITLFSGVGGAGSNFISTTLSDAALVAIAQGSAPFTGAYRPASSLGAALAGQLLQGTWQLRIIDKGASGSTTRLNGWSLTATPAVTVKPLDDGGAKGTSRTFQVGFPQQAYSGTYTVQLASSITSATGDALDTNENAGVAVLRDTPSLTTPVTYTSAAPQVLAPGATETATIVVPDNFTISGLQVNFDATEANDPDLTATLIGPDGTSITLFSNVGSAGSHANFTRTVFDDSSGTPIQNGGPPFTGRFRPQQPLGSFVGKMSAGTWKLVISSNNPQGLAGSLNSWGLSFNTVTYAASDAPKALPVGSTISSTIAVPGSFTVQNPTVTLDISEPYDPGLTAKLVAPDGKTTITLFQNPSPKGANFTQTTFDDHATTLIQNGSPPYSGTFVPQQALSGFAGMNAAGLWTLELTTDTTKTDGQAKAGTLNGWSLTFQQVAPISGLGEPGADQFSTSFRIFTTSPTNPVSSSSWTPVGPTSVGTGSSGALGTSAQPGGYAGRVTSVAVDPSDPSGNTVFAAAASGGVWKTTDFLTTDPAGPTWIPLTDFGPTYTLNIGSIAVFPRNNDPGQSIIFAGTGEGNTDGASAGVNINGNTSQGVGILRSTDGGRSWTLLDSTDNTLPFSVPASAPPGTPVRDHIFAANGGTSTFKIVVDPRPTTTGSQIVYAAMGSRTDPKTNASNGNGGLYRSLDGGNTWQKMSSAAQGDATDVVLDLNSATVDQVANPTGNVNIIYAGFENGGVYISPNRGQTLNPIAGNAFDPLIRQADVAGDPSVPVTNGAPAMNGLRITLAKPGLVPSTAPNADVENLLYEGWLYALVSGVGKGDRYLGLFVTKDYGQTWTRIGLPTLPSNNGLNSDAVPTNDVTQPNYDPTSNVNWSSSPYNLSLAVDANNPAVVYIGGSGIAGGVENAGSFNAGGLIRVDTTALLDSHAFVAYSGAQNDGGKLDVNSAGGVTLQRTDQGLPYREVNLYSSNFYSDTTPYLNLLVDPSQPFETNSTLYLVNVGSFTNSGAGVRWTSLSQLLQASATDGAPSTNVHQALTLVDPLTGQTRLILADDQGVFSGVVNADGSINFGIGTAVAATYSRNGDLQIAQVVQGATQPSAAAAQVANALYYSNSTNVGFSASSPGILSSGDTGGNGDVGSSVAPRFTTGERDGSGIATDQQGQGIVYQYANPGFAGTGTNFFQVSVNGSPFVSRTSGLVQQGTSLDPQWPNDLSDYGDGIRLGLFAVNPIDGNQVIISSGQGRIFSTINQGDQWQVIGNPGDLDGSYAPALAFGAPDPGGPNGTSNLNDFLYAGTLKGNVYLTQTGGGGAGNQWTNVSNGLDGSAVVQIATNPTRGSHEAYAVTEKGVYHIADSVLLANELAANAAAAKAGTAAPYTAAQLAAAGWQNITGNLPMQTPANPTAQLAYLSSIVADWRYVIPNNPSAPADPVTNPTHPVLYVAGEGGVYRSLDDGQSWAAFPNVALDGAPVDGGLLPNAHVTSLSASLGNIDPTTGRAVAKVGDPNTLLASTYGRGQFAIRLAPVVFPNTNAPGTPLNNLFLDPADDSGITPAQRGDGITNVTNPHVDGFSEQTAFGNTVYVSLINLADPTHPIIGGYNPANPNTAVAANQTDSSGHFKVNFYKALADGTYTIGVQATDQSGTKGNIAPLTITVDTSAEGPPGAPTLEPGSDSGVAGDGVTNDNNSKAANAPLFDTSVTDTGSTVTLERAPLSFASSSSTTVPVGPVISSTIVVPISSVSQGDQYATITGLTLDLTKLSVSSYSGLEITLTGPDGTTVAVPGVGNAVTITGLNGHFAEGSYTLSIANAGQGSGTFSGWSMSLTSQSSTTPATSATRTFSASPASAVTVPAAAPTATSTLTIPATSLGNAKATIPGLVLDLSKLVIPNASDLVVTLTGPDGTTIPIAGPYTGTMAITGLNGKLAAGTYKLSITNTDPTGKNAGSLGGWSLELAGVNGSGSSVGVGSTSTTTVTIGAGSLPVAAFPPSLLIPATDSISSTIAVPASNPNNPNATITSLTLDISRLTDATPAKLTITLTGPDGTKVTVPGIGNAVTIAGLKGKLAAGNYTLAITNNGTAPAELGGWSLSVADSNGGGARTYQPSAIVDGAVLDLSQLGSSQPINATITLTGPDGTKVTVPTPTGPGAPIPANGTATSQIVVPASSLSSGGATVSSLKLDLTGLSFPSPKSLTITLTGPDGTKVTVPGIGNAVTITGLNGKAAAGTYTLSIANASGQVGVLSGWRLTLGDNGGKSGVFPGYGRYVDLTGLNGKLAAGTYTLSITNNGSSPLSLGGWSVGLPGTITGMTAVSTLGAALAGTPPLAVVGIADANAGNGSIADGVYVYSAIQTDLAGNNGPIGPGTVVTIDTTGPALPAPTLTAASDSGLPLSPRDADDITAVAFSTFAGTAEPGASVALFVNGKAAGSAKADPVTGAYSVTSTLALLPGLNQIQVQETDVAGNAGLRSASRSVLYDASVPTLIVPTLVQDPFNDTGRSDTDTVTKNANPTFVGVAQVSPLLNTPNFPSLDNPSPEGAGALIQLYARAVVNGAFQGQPFLVGEGLADPITGAYSVTVGKYINPQPAGAVTKLGDGQYYMSAVQYNVAGTPSTPLNWGITQDVVIDTTNAPLNFTVLSDGSDGGLGWDYIQHVFSAVGAQAVADSAATPKTLVVLGAQTSQSSFGVLPAAVNAAQTSFTRSQLPGQGWKIVYVSGAANITAYLGGQAVPATDANNDPLGTITLGAPASGQSAGSLGQTGMLYLTTANVTPGDIDDAELAAINAGGAALARFIGTGRGFFAEGENATSAQTTSPPYGWLAAVYPQLRYVRESDFSSSAQTPLMVTPAGQAIIPGLTAVDFTSGQAPETNGYFPSGSPPYYPLGIPQSGLAVAATNYSVGQRLQEPVILASNGATLAVDPAQVTIDTDGADPKPTAAPILELASDTSGGLNITRDDNSPANNQPAPVFDVTNVEAEAEVQLFRTPVDPTTGKATGPTALVNTTYNGAAAGTVAIADINQSNPALSTAGPVIPDGTYFYTEQQTDVAGGTDPMSAPVRVTILATPPPAPVTLKLDPGSDTGRFNNDNITADDNGKTGPAPVFDVTGIKPNTKVELLRDGAVVRVLTNPNPANGVLTIADINNPTPDTTTPGAVIPDGSHTYVVVQVDVAGNISAASPTVAVTIDSDGADPNPAPAPILEAGSDTSKGLNVTSYNNATPATSPVFDVKSVEAGGTVQLFRTPVDPKTLKPVGPTVLVNAIYNSGASSATIAIADINQPNPALMPASGGPIPDGTYLYFDTVTDLAGVTNTPSPNTQVTIAANAPATPSPFRLDPASDTGRSNSDGITRITLTSFPTFDVTGVVAGATVSLYRTPVNPATLAPTGPTVLAASQAYPTGGAVTIQDHNSIPDGTYTYTAVQTNVAGVPSQSAGPIVIRYVTTAQPLTGPPALDSQTDTGTVGDNVTSSRNPILDVPGVTAHDTLELVRDGNVVQTIYDVGAAGGTIVIQDPGDVPGGFNPVSFGRHTYQAIQIDAAGNPSPLSQGTSILIQADRPGALTLDPVSDSGVKGDDITNVTTNLTFDVSGVTAGATLNLLRNGAVVATLNNVPGGTVMITDAPGPGAAGQYSYAAQQVIAGSPSASGPALLITVDTSTPPTPTGLALDLGSDTGVKGDNLTDSTTPTIDVSGILPGATVQLYRNGVLVATQVAGSAGGTVAVTDASGVGTLTKPTAFKYTAQQVSVAGNPSSPSTALTVTIDTTVPGTPTLALDPTDQSSLGVTTTDVPNPTIDVSGVTAGVTVTLYRDGVPIKSVPVTTAPSGKITITDPGPLTDGNYRYTAVQASTAGTPSGTSAPLTVTVNLGSSAGLTTPTLALAPSSDSGIAGDNVTSLRQLTFTGTATPAGVTVTVYNLATNAPLGTTTSDAQGHFSVTATAPLADGNYSFYARSLDGNNNQSPPSATLGVQVTSVPGDYNGAGTTDAAVVRRTSSSLMQWFVQGVQTSSFGAGGLDVPLAGDLDGDGKADLILYRPSAATWYVALSSQGGSPISFTLGEANLDIPVVGDFYGNGQDEPAVYRPTTHEWFIGGQNASTAFGGPNDVPVPGHYAPAFTPLAISAGGTLTSTITVPQSALKSPFAVVTGLTLDLSSLSFPTSNLADLTVTLTGPDGTQVPLHQPYNNNVQVTQLDRKAPAGTYTLTITNSGAQTGTFGGWGLALAASGNTSTINLISQTAPVTTTNGPDELAVYRAGAPSNWFILGPSGAYDVEFGGPNDVPVPGNYDDTATYHYTEEAVFRPSTGQYFILGPNGAPRVVQFQAGDIPAPGDYDGLGYVEPAVYRPSTSQWLVQGPNDASPRLLTTFGGPNDVPALSPYHYRSLGMSAQSVNFGGTAAKLLVAPSPSSAVATVVPPAAAAAAPQPQAQVSAAVASHARPNQGPARGQHPHRTPAHPAHVHDAALAALQGGWRRLRGRLLGGPRG